MPAEQLRLVQRAAEGRPHAGDRPVVVGEARQPPQQLLVLGERDVVEERIAAVEEPRHASLGHVAEEPVVLPEVDGAAAVGAADERRHGEHAAEVVGGEPGPLHREALRRSVIRSARGPLPGPPRPTPGATSSRPPVP